MLRGTGVVARCLLAGITAVTAACTGVQFFLANAPTVVGAFDRKTNLSYGADPRQRLDLYAPRDAVSRPVVIFWYGGSWTQGRKSNYRFVGAALAERGFVVVVPDYRLYPAVKFPLFLQDAAQSVAWVQQHAAEFGGDPHRIVLMGHSAGAHMAAFLAYNHEFLAAQGGHPEWIRGLIGLSGPYALSPNSDLLHRIFASPYTNEDWQPVRFIDATAPPTLLFHGVNDDVVEVGHARTLRDALIANHISIEAEIEANLSHADTVAAFARGARYRAPVLERSAKFIERVCASPAAALSQPGVEPSASGPARISARTFALLPRAVPPQAASPPRTYP